ncbi:MAG: NADH-quinone oxidoreductase subunit C [Planctomycetes bacterium]|nr:NADH-quinone oxidoreductase subunit C [Planctomycetota bacterium]
MAVESTRIKERFAGELLDAPADARQPHVSVKRGRIVELMRYLRDDPDMAYDCLTDVTAVDYLNRGLWERFAVVYNLYSFSRNERFRVKAFVPEDDPAIESVAALWPAASWAEREAFDMYGIRFTGHPDLRRILMPDDYPGHPLRKDYPLKGRGERARFPRYSPQED